MEPMPVHRQIAALNVDISQGISQLRRAGAARDNVLIYSWEAVQDCLNAAQSMLMMLALRDIDADDPTAEGQPGD